MTADASDGEFDAIVVGCGPVGAVAANLLGQQGLKTAVLERDRQPYTLPRAIHLDHEVMRILQSAGLAQRVLPCLTVPGATVHIGADGGVIRQLRTFSMAPHLGWASDYFFYQPELEARLRAGLAGRCNVEARYGHTVQSVQQDESGVDVAAIENESGVEHRLRGRYLLACDGASSVVRRQLGVPLDDLGFEEPWVVIDARVRGPISFPEFSGLPEGADLQRTLVMIGDPARPLTVIPGKDDHRRWECMLLPGETDEEMTRPGHLAKILHPWIRNASCEIIRAAVYRFHGLIAQTWRAGRVFLVGDAAHQSPPFYGQGLCHGIRDAANLAWKLRLVLNERASTSLLDTYQSEREPQVRRIIEASIKTGRYICTLDPEIARQRDAAMREVVKQTPPGYVDIVPPLDRGLVFDADRASRGAGARFIQPRVAVADGNELLLDEATGGGCVILARTFDPIDGMSTELRRFWRGVAGSTFRVAHPGERVSAGSSPLLIDVTVELGKWFDRNACDGVILRPDAYVYASFSNAADLHERLSALQSALAGRRTITGKNG